MQTELNRQGIEDLNNVQALILFNIRDDELTVGELTNRGYYLGSNVSYNLRKMAEHGYLVQERSPHDRRSVRVRVSDKGLALCEKIDAMFNRQLDAVDDMQLGRISNRRPRSIGCSSVSGSGRSATAAQRRAPEGFAARQGRKPRERHESPAAATASRAAGNSRNGSAADSTIRTNANG